jgi:hypothetical protein
MHTPMQNPMKKHFLYFLVVTVTHEVVEGAIAMPQ